MDINEHMKTEAATTENAAKASVELGAKRRAAIAKLGRMAAFGSPVLMTLLMSDRASAESPPFDPST
jgi:hypothetical protein